MRRAARGEAQPQASGRHGASRLRSNTARPDGVRGRGAAASPPTRLYRRSIISPPDPSFLITHTALYCTKTGLCWRKDAARSGKVEPIVPLLRRPQPPPHPLSHPLQPPPSTRLSRKNNALTIQKSYFSLRPQPPPPPTPPNPRLEMSAMILSGCAEAVRQSA